jgi:hypothetical protein
MTGGARTMAACLKSAERDLVAFPAMLEGRKVETASLAYDTAVELSGHALDVAETSPADAAEPLHDALSRLGALSSAGAIGKIT